MIKEVIAGSMIVYGAVQGVYSALTNIMPNSYGEGIFLGVAAIVAGGVIATERKKESKLAKGLND